MHEQYYYNVWGSRSERHDLLHNQIEHYSYDAEARVTGAQARLAAAYDRKKNRGQFSYCNIPIIEVD